MKVTVLEGRQMSARLLDEWRELRRGNPDLRSPFFCPDFTLAIAEARHDVRIAVIEHGGAIAGLFPFQTNGTRIGKPIGNGLCDYHGIICSPDFDCDALALLRACGLIAWDFDHLLPSQPCFSQFHRKIENSPLIDLTRGFKAYLEERRAAGSALIGEINRKARRLEREAGGLRFAVHTGEEEIFRRVLSWRAANLGDRFITGTPWVMKSLDKIRKIGGPDFAGLLSVLYAGEVPVAGHFGMRSETVWHWWLAGYNQDYKPHSPGSILLYKMVEAAEGMGIRVIDLGKGEALYKDRFKNGEALVAEGSVEGSAFLRLRRQAGRKIRSLAKGALIGTPLESPARKLIAILRGSPV